MADAFSYATLYEDESSITRLLRDHSASKNVNARSPGMIAWFCFIVTAVLPTFLCVLYCWFTRYRSHRRAQTTLDRELQHENDLVISRMEANIQAFSRVEKNLKTKSIRTAIRRHVVVRRYIHCAESSGSSCQWLITRCSLFLLISTASLRKGPHGRTSSRKRKLRRR